MLIERKWSPSIVCNDGVMIATEVKLKDPAKDLGAQMLRQAAEKTGEALGDGTSTAKIPAHAIPSDALRNVVAGASAVDLRRGLHLGVKPAIGTLQDLSKPVGTQTDAGGTAMGWRSDA